MPEFIAQIRNTGTVHVTRISLSEEAMAQALDYDALRALIVEQVTQKHPGWDVAYFVPVVPQGQSLGPDRRTFPW